MPYLASLYFPFCLQAGGELQQPPAPRRERERHSAAPAVLRTPPHSNRSKEAGRPEYINGDSRRASSLHPHRENTHVTWDDYQKKKIRQTSGTRGYVSLPTPLYEERPREPEDNSPWDAALKEAECHIAAAWFPCLSCQKMKGWT